MIKVSNDGYVDERRVYYVSSYKGNYIKNKVAEKKKDGKCIDTTKNTAIKTVIFLDNETIILTSVLPETICLRLGSVTLSADGSNNPNDASM